MEEGVNVQYRPGPGHRIISRIYNIPPPLRENVHSYLASLDGTDHRRNGHMMKEIYIVNLNELTSGVTINSTELPRTYDKHIFNSTIRK